MRRQIFLLIGFLLVVIVIIPAIIVRGCQLQEKAPTTEGKNYQINLYLTKEHKTVKMPLEDYIKGVVAAEMPAAFNSEALKAQAVAARTFTVRKMRAFGGSGCNLDGKADVCDDPKHCQAWLPQSALKGKWGSDYQAYWDKISAAVSGTRDLVITYNGQPIDPAYSSTCGGHTENSEDVWSSTVPYLRGVACPYCKESSKMHSTVSFTPAELAKKLNLDVTALKAVPAMKNGSVPGVMEIKQRSVSGRVLAAVVGGKQFKGTELRTKLGLNSTNFTWSIDSGKVKFAVTGYGHGIGMCQYGANGMALQGKSYLDILKYYYTDIEIRKME